MIKVDNNANPSAAALLLPSFLAICFLTELLVAQCWHPLRIGHDQALYLQCGFLLRHGGVPYVDFLDSNPPLIFYINTIPAGLSQLLHAPPPLTFNIFTWVMVAVSTLLCRVLMLRRIQQKEFVINLPLLISLPLFSCCLNGDFGQREHLFVIFYFPFLLARWLRWSGCNLANWEACLVAIFGGIGLSLKPHFLLAAIVFEAYWLFDKKNYRTLLKPECYICALVIAIYAIHFLFLPEAVRESYFGFLVPMFFYGYSFWDSTTIFMLGIGNWGKIFPFVCMAMILAIYLRKQNSLLLPMMVFSLACLVTYLIQGKGWSYHPLPCIFAAMVLGLIEFWLMIRYLWLRLRFSIDVLLCVVTLAVLVSMWHAFTDDVANVRKEDLIDLNCIGFPGYSSTKRDLGSFAPAILKRTCVNDRVVVISNGVQPAYPALTQLQRWPGSRHPQALLLSMFDYVADQPSNPVKKRLVGMKQKVMDEYAEDIQRFAPTLVAIQTSPLFEFVERFHFVENNLRDYRRVDEFNGFFLYQKR